MRPFTPLIRQPQDRHVLRHWVRVSDGQPEQSGGYSSAMYTYLSGVLWVV
jgi:hypothetical protein